ncbi:MAG TPA: hypothetical protein VK137_08685, partial [Planctomycetaceae bacterium]|nr:hypothetical protein [Planctomycetaceae bacterium]
KERLPPKLVFAQPFVAALEIPNAMYARLGNQMLEAVAYSAPQQIPQDLLSGRIKDLFDSTNVEGYGFSIRFSGITYKSQLNQIRIKAHAKDRLNIQVGLTKAVLTIAGTSVMGEDHAAQTGPIQVVIGHQRPVWLSVDLTPVVENRRLRLRQVGARFDIPHDNWYVTSPAGVSVQGFGMTREKVSSGLVNGLYGSKHRIENEVLSVVPKLLDALEEKLAERSEAGDVAARFWPLPVYKPRVRFWPQDVSTDENGVTIVLGLSAASIDSRKAPQQPTIADLKAVLPAELPQIKALQVGLVPDMLEPLTELLVKSDVARIHVLDIPENTFAKFADKAALTEAIPELKRHGDTELWSELSLASGIRVEDVGGEQDTTRMRFHVPKLVIAISLLPATKTAVAGGSELSDAAGSGDPRRATPFAMFEAEFKQTAVAELLKPDSQTRAVKFAWDVEPELQVTCRFADGYQPE